MAEATVTIEAKINGLDAMEAYIDALDTVVSQRERIAELEAELAATRWQSMGTAPKDESYVLVRVRWCDEPCIARYLNGLWRPSTEHVDAEGGWDGAVVVSRLGSGDVYQWAPLPTEPVTPERQGEPEIDSEQPKVSP